jgi:UDP-glucuronate 4-epimerase
MNILVTGAAGFIGSHVSEYLINQGHQILGLDNFDNYYPKKIKLQNLFSLEKNNKFLFYDSDIRDSELLKKIFSSNHVDSVIHLAAKAGVRPSLESVSEYYDVNVNGTIAILEAMREHGVKKMLFASSSSVYGNNKKVPFSETDNVDYPISPYASTKKSAELICHVYSHLYNFDITCLRFFTVFGPRQRPDLAIHKFTRLIDLGKPVPFYGDGSSSRDYTYIDDIVSGVNCALQHLSGYHIYNLGESRVIDLNNLVATIEEIIGKKAILDKLPQQLGDVNITYADISKAKDEIGYNPIFNFREGVAEFIKWYYQYKHIFNNMP